MELVGLTADVVLSDTWLQSIAGFAFTGLVGAITWLANNQRRSNSALVDVARTMERVTTTLSGHDDRLARVERWQDTDRYADVIEQRRREH